MKTYVVRWEEARELKKPTALYNTVTTDFIIRFGYDSLPSLDSTGSPSGDILDPVDGEKVPGTAGLMEEEAAVKVAYYTKLRRVRSIFVFYAVILICLALET